VPCNANPTDLVKQSAMSGFTVNSLDGSQNIADGYHTSADGSKVSVAGDIHVNAVGVDVLIGDTH